MEIQPFCGDGQFGHVFLAATRMAADEIWNNLLVQSLLAVDTVEYPLEFMELTERRFAHEAQHIVARVFRCNFQTSAYMMANKFAGIFGCCPVDFFVLASV